GLSTSPSGEDQSRCSALWLHVGDGRHHFLPVRRSHAHGRFADVLLPPDKSAGISRYSLSRTRRAVRQAAAQHAPVGCALDDHHSLAAYVSRFLDRILQEAARIQLERWGDLARADVAAFVHWLSAAGRS